MKRKFLYIASTLVILTAAACGPAPTPTLSASDIANTAVANAWIVITLTQAAMPTATPIPPTSTPLPTFTLLPTMPVVIAPTIAPPVVAATQGIDPCNDIPPAKPKGTLVKVKFTNKSGGAVNLSFGMTHENDLGECGTYTFTMAAFDAPEATVLAGCYWGFAWVSGKKPSTARSTADICLTDPAKMRSVTITSEWIGLD